MEEKLNNYTVEFKKLGDEYIYEESFNTEVEAYRFLEATLLLYPLTEYRIYKVEEVPFWRPHAAYRLERQ